jgi:hypothetical protein
MFIVDYLFKSRAEALRRRENIFVNPYSLLCASASLRETKRKIRSIFLDYTGRFFGQWRRTLVSGCLGQLDGTHLIFGYL